MNYDQHFNPYDLNHVADIDLFIEARKQRGQWPPEKITVTPSRGILAPLNSTELSSNTSNEPAVPVVRVAV